MICLKYSFKNKVKRDMRNVKKDVAWIDLMEQEIQVLSNTFALKGFI